MNFTYMYKLYSLDGSMIMGKAQIPKVAGRKQDI